MNLDKLNPTVKAAIDALQSGNRNAWEKLFTSDAKMFDDGSERDLNSFTRDAVGQERFTSINKIENDGCDVFGEFHSPQWGDFQTYFKFKLDQDGKINRLDIGQG